VSEYSGLDACDVDSRVF